MNHITTGMLVSIWDNGETYIETQCTVNLIDRTITGIDVDNMSMLSPYHNFNEAGENVKNLEKQCLKLNGHTFPVINEHSTSAELEEAGLIDTDKGCDKVEWGCLPFMLI